MSLEKLSDPLAGELPAGEDCQAEIQSQNLALMTEYLAERAVQKARDRSAGQTGLGEGEARNAEALREDGKRRLTTLEGILKDVLKQSAVSTEQVSRALHEKCSVLLAQRGKDLRLMPHLAAAAVMMDGIDGYADALSLVESLLAAYPQTLFPLPDETDPDDPWERANAVSELFSGAEVLALLGPVVVIDARQSGRLTLADLVGGLRDDMAVPEVSAAELNMALKEVGAERVEHLKILLHRIEACITRLVQAFNGVLASPRLADTVRRAAARLDGFAEAATPTQESAAAPTPQVGGNGSGTALPRAGLRSRDDARLAIQDVIHLIERLEPGHPAPLLLRRANRLLGMSFVDIIKDLAPNALSDVERIIGTEPSS